MTRTLNNKSGLKLNKSIYVLLINSVSLLEDSEVVETSTNPINIADEQDAISIASDKSSQETLNINVFEKTYKSDHSSSISYSEELQKYENRILQLEEQNLQLNSQLLNLQHLYSELKNENSLLNEQLQRANECVAATNVEMEQYRIRAQRVLQEKEKLIAYKQQIGPDDSECDDTILGNYLEELK